MPGALTGIKDQLSLERHRGSIGEPGRSLVAHDH